jgi:uncharacterized membrane protein
MTIFLIVVWVLTFFVSFLVFQEFDRERQFVSKHAIWSNLTLASIPVLNILLAFWIYTWE